MSGRDAGDRLESPLLDLGGDFLANFAVAGIELIEPSLAQRVDPIILGPADPGLSPLAGSGGLSQEYSISAPRKSVPRTFQPPFATGFCKADGSPRDPNQSSRVGR